MTAAARPDGKVFGQTGSVAPSVRRRRWMLSLLLTLSFLFGLKFPGGHDLFRKSDGSVEVFEEVGL